MDKMRIALIGIIMMVIGSMGYAGTYEKEIYLDMTILWGGTLPEAVYILPDYNDDSGIQLQKWEDGTWKSLANSGLYNDSNRNNGIEPNYSAGLKLTDDNFDGIYTGKVKYIGNDGKKVKTRLYIRKNDTFNTLHTPYYERKSGVNGEKTIDSEWRPIVGNGDAIKWSWEDKWVSSDEGGRPVEYKSSHTIYKGLSSELGIVNVPYTNADTVLRRDVANNIAWSSSDENIAYIEKIYDNIGTVQYVKSVRIIGKNTGTATITIRFGLNSSTTNGNLVYRAAKTISVTVQDYNPITPFQTVILNAESDITSNDIIRIDNNSSFYTATTTPLAATFAPDTRESALANPYNFATTTYTSFATPVGGEGYLWWVPSVVRTGAVLHLTRWNSTGTAPKDLEVAIWKNKDSSQEIKSTLKIPSPVGGMSANISSSAKKFYWNENLANYSDYTKRDVIVRISKVDMSRTNMRYDLWEGKNPIVRADDATVVDTSKMSTFDKSTGLNYLDYVFSGANTLISVDGRMVKSDMYSSGERTITISKFPVGKYRIQLYTLRSNLNSMAVSGIKNYSVLTFEGEDIFEVTSKDYDEDNTVEEDSYYINKINPYNFPTIQTYIMTRSKYLITPSINSIFYNGTSGKVGERMEDSSGADGFSSTGLPGENITVTADTTYQSVKPQMDIVLCLDRSSSMSSRMEVVKETWKKFEANMAKRGYDVKYQMVSFGGAITSWWYEPYGGQVIHDGWVNSLIDNSGIASPTSYETAYINGNKFQTTSNEGGYEPSNQALYKAADILNNKGRTIGEKKSKRYIIFFTDEGGLESGMDVDYQEKYIRGSGVTLIGLGQVYINDAATKTQMFDDDSGEPVSGGSGRYYYDLKILLGDIFKWYQITNDSDNMLKKLERGMVNAGYTTFWKIEHKTPYPLENYTKRSVEFEIRESTINGTVGTKAMKYGGIAEERVYRAPNLLITGKIDTPKENDAFQLNPKDNTKYIIKGKMWGELTFEDLSIPMAYADLSQIDLRIFKDKSVNNPENYDNADALIINGTDEKIMSKTGVQLSKDASDGSYSFEFNVEDKKLQSTGLDSFFVKLTAKSSSSGKEGSIGQQNIKLDSDPPKLVDIKMVNTTVVTAMSAMKASDSEDNAFNMDITALNTLWYTPYSDATLASDTTEITNPVLTNRIRKDSAQVPYDGRFVKNGDNLTITALFIDQNFDEASSTALKNYITATFTGLETLPVTKTPTITTKIVPLTGGEKAVEITAVWSVTVANSSTADSVIKMNITAADKYGNKSSDSDKKNYVGDIEIAKLDNVNPGYPEWYSSNPIGNTGGTALTPFAAKKDSAITPVITKDAYRINCYDGATTDTNGIRAFKVYYTYDDTKSDVADAKLANETGNHDSDLISGDVHWFYIKAGDAVNLSGNTDTIIPAIGYGEKTPNSNHGDDGKYIFKITAVDKAGNETMYSATKGAIESDGASRAVYVDTVAPRIDRGQIYVVKYADSPNYTLANYWNIIKNGDKAYIHTKIADFSAISADISGVATLRDRYYKSGSYPEYSEMIGNGVGVENPVFGVLSTTISNNINTVELKIGDLTYSGGEASPSMLISGRANESYLAPIIIGAKDLAGNEFIDSGITCQVDNIKPTTPVIKAYAMESKYNPENHGVENFKELNGNDYTAQNVKDIDSKDNVIHFTKKMAYILRNLAVIDSDVTKAIIYSNGNQRSFDKDSYYTIDFYIHFGKNEVKMQLLDKAGNLSDESNIDEIVIDKSVPDGNQKYIFTSPKPAKKNEDKYTIDISITGLKDYTGLQKIQVMKLVKPVNPTKSDCEEVKPTGSELINNAPAKDLSVERSISGTVDLEVPQSRVGTRVDFEVYLYDNMGNKSSKLIYRVLIPTTASATPTILRSQQEGSNKEIRTNVDVINKEMKIDLQKTEEGGIFPKNKKE